jgi:hypothetical protein
VPPGRSPFSQQEEHCGVAMTEKRLDAIEIQIEARRGFRRWLWAQQLEEASFLYEQRCFLLDTDQLPWVDIADNEQRYQRHLFALDLLTRNSDGYADLDGLIEDAGGLHTAVSLYCRQGRFSALEAAIASTDLTDAARFTAIADALKWELPLSWRHRILKLAEAEEDRYIDLLAILFGYRRWPLDAVFDLAPNHISPEMIWAIGRSGATDGVSRLKAVLNADCEGLKTDAAIQLLRLGYSRHLQEVFPIVNPNHWGILPLGLSGMGAYQERLERLAAMAPSETVLLAIGLLGRPTAVELLISLLSHEHLGGDASLALQLVTGADLRETVFVPDEIVPDELIEAERIRYEQGEPLFAPGEIPGETVERLSRDPSVWMSWWRIHRPEFRSDTPYRLGKPYAPMHLVDQLAFPQSNGLLRRLAYEELVIRYRIDFAFETDFSVCEQQRLLLEFRRWLAVHREVASRYVG